MINGNAPRKEVSKKQLMQCCFYFGQSMGQNLLKLSFMFWTIPVSASFIKNSSRQSKINLDICEHFAQSIIDVNIIIDIWLFKECCKTAKNHVIQLTKQRRRQLSCKRCFRIRRWCRSGCWRARRRLRSGPRTPCTRPKHLRWLCQRRQSWNLFGTLI